MWGRCCATMPEDWQPGHAVPAGDDPGARAVQRGAPRGLPFVDVEVDKKPLSAIVNDLAERYPKVQVAATLDALKAAGFHWATRAGVTISHRATSSPRRRKNEILDALRGTAEKVAEPVQRA